MTQVFHRRRRGGDDVRFYFKTITVHADGRPDSALSIDRETALDDMDNFAIVRNGDGTRRFERPGDIVVIDHLSRYPYDALGVDRGHVRSCQTDEGSAGFVSR